MNRRRATIVALVFAASLAAVGLATDSASRQWLLNSVLLACGAMAIALPVGSLLAVLLARTNVAGRTIVIPLLGMLLFLPLLVQLSGWDAALGKLGWLALETGEINRPWLAGMRGAIWVHGVAAVPWTTAIVAVGLLQTEPQLEEVALLDADPAAVLLRVTLPGAWPFVVTAAVWTAVATTAEMTVTNIYLVDTFTERLYNALALNSEAMVIGWRVWPGILLLGVLAAATLTALRRLAQGWDIVRDRPPLRFELGRWRLLLSGLVWAVVVALVALPLGSLVVKAGWVTQRGAVDGRLTHGWSPARFAQVLGEAPLRFWQEIAWSLAIAATAATCALIVAIALSWFGRHGGWRRLPLAVGLVLGMAVPGPLVAMGLIWLLNRTWPPGLTYLYDRTIVPPALAQAIRCLPAALLIAWPALTTIGRDTLEAAELEGATRWQQLTLIALPLRWRAMLAAWVVAAGVALGDLSYSLLLVPPGMDTLQRRIFGLVHAGVDEQVAAACLLIALLYAVAAIGLRMLFRPAKGLAAQGSS